jgi:hypothetical protein
MATPKRDLFGNAVEGIKRCDLVKLNKCGVAQLGASLRPSSSSNRSENGAASQSLEKLVQMELDRLEGLLQHEQHNQIKGQAPGPRKVLFARTMPCQKSKIADQSTSTDDE